MELAADVCEESYEDKYNLSIKCLRAKTKEIISAALNPIMVLPTDEKLPRDWQGLAELVEIPGERITQLQLEKDPTLKVLNLWSNTCPDDCTISRLFQYFEKLDRFDIIDDIRDLVDLDIQSTNEPSDLQGQQSKSEINDADILTRDDYDSISNGQGPQMYDAFVLFADEDMDFATKLIDTMEKEYNLKFCTKHRDLIGGTFVHEVIIKLIQERCTRLLVIFSNHFFKSTYNEYFTNFAQILGIDQNSRKLIPLCYEPCDIPFKWRCYSMLDYNRHKKYDDIAQFWKKLHDSVKMSVHQPPRRSNTIKPAMARSEERENSLRVKKEGVTFSKSLTDINNADKIENETIDISSSTSSNSLNIISKNFNKKPKKSWLTFFNYHSVKNNSEGSEKKSKKNIFSRSSKRKAVPLAS